MTVSPEPFITAYYAPSFLQSSRLILTSGLSNLWVGYDHTTKSQYIKLMVEMVKNTDPLVHLEYVLYAGQYVKIGMKSHHQNMPNSNVPMRKQTFGEFAAKLEFDLHQEIRKRISDEKFQKLGQRDKDRLNSQ